MVRSLACVVALLVTVGTAQAQSPHAASSDGGLGTVLVGLIISGLIVYPFPTLVAYFRGHPNTVAIAALNLLAGWMFVGWVGALVWSLLVIRDPDGSVDDGRPSAGRALFRVSLGTAVAIVFVMCCLIAVKGTQDQTAAKQVAASNPEAPSPQKATRSKLKPPPPGVEITDTDTWQIWVKANQEDNPRWHPPVYERVKEIKSVNHCRFQFQVVSRLSAGVYIVKVGGDEVWFDKLMDDLREGLSYTIDGLCKPIGTRETVNNEGTVTSYPAYRWCGRVPPPDYVPSYLSK